MKTLLSHLGKLFRSPQHQQDEPLLTLVQVAAEDPGIRQQLITILEMPENLRQRQLDQWVRAMRSEGAPSTFTDLIAKLGEPDIAAKLLEYLNSLDINPPR